MKRFDESDLLSFCTQQKHRFVAAAWEERAVGHKDLIAVVAFFLASMRWYGHRGALLAVADKLHHGCAEHFPSLVVETDFDCARFAEMLKARFSHEHATF